jgi:uncharacterized protein (TIGR02996 family)
MPGEVERALTAAVRANPDDWAAQLVFADWLIERGDVRGRLIAWEHALATRALSADERAAVQRQIHTLEAAHREEWLAWLTLPASARLEWRCGFLIGVQLRWNARTLAALDRLVAHPVARLIKRLDLSRSHIDAAAASALAASDSLRSFTELRLPFNDIGCDGARALAGSDSLGSLATLDLGYNRIGDEGVRALAGGNLRSLTRLNLRNNGIGDDGARALAASETLSSLTELNLVGNALGAGVRALRESESLRGCTVQT